MRLAVLAVLLLAGPVARADHGASTDTCEHDPRCYARELAAALTRSEHSVELAHVVDFEPGRVRVYSKSREKLQAIVATWRTHHDWSTITVHGYAGAAQAALAQRRADKIRGYLIRYGIPADLVVAIGHASPALATAELSIELCPRDAPCARP